MRHTPQSGASSRPRIWHLLVALCLPFVVQLVSFGAAAEAQQGDAKAGKAVYDRKCLLCHGEKGDGKGPAAELLVPRPRDFTSGLYKIRSTVNKVPTDQDIFRIITNGMPGTSMPGWEVLPEKDRWSLVAYVKSFAGDKLKEAPKKVDLPKEVSSSDASLKRGKEMYEAIECNKCHGATGRADGPSRPELKDEWGQPIAPANLAKRWNFRGGKDRTEIATRLAVGVLGTPMPAFLEAVEKPEDIWHLTNYILSLGNEPKFATLVPIAATKDSIPDDPAADFWKKISPNAIPLMGQVIIDPRNFNPSIDLVVVRGAWNDQEIAFHLTWDDPSESKTADQAKKLFTDAIALQFPPKITPGPERPYFLMGDDSDAVYLLRWDQGKGVGEATANGPAKVKAMEGSEASGKAVYKDGRYELVIKRALAGKGDRPTFQPGVFTPVAFQAWDGGEGETGARMSLTSWYYLRLEEPQSNRRFVVPPVVAILTLAAMLVVVRAANRRR